MINVLFVCMGNICRSPSGEAVMKKLVKRAKLDEKIQSSNRVLIRRVKNKFVNRMYSTTCLSVSDYLHILAYLIY